MYRASGLLDLGDTRCVQGQWPARLGGYKVCTWPVACSTWPGVGPRQWDRPGREAFNAVSLGLDQQRGAMGGL